MPGSLVVKPPCVAERPGAERGGSTARRPTPPEHRHPMFILVNLALGGGWPIDKTPDPSYMYVDYIRAYAAAP